jgi:TonB family protein
MVKEEIDLVVIAEEKRKTGGLSLSVIVSVVLHSALIAWFILGYKPLPPAAEQVPMARYIELMQQQPREFTEAPGPEVDRAPLTAPLSDRNRRASMPEPTGVEPTKRPGDGSGGIFNPPGNPAPRAPQQRPVAPSAPQQQQQAEAQQPAPNPAAAPPDAMIYRQQQQQPTQANAAAGTIDWNKAISQVKVASLGGGDGLDLGRLGGEIGSAEQGPLSFETQWYDWGDYAQSMVSRIRVNWYANMPRLIRDGVKGVVTIQFVIHRDGRISDVVIVKSSGAPPYDLAAKKAIELSSPLRALPQDFPKPSERVTCMFYYNMDVPRG